LFINKCGQSQRDLFEFHVTERGIFFSTLGISGKTRPADLKKSVGKLGIPFPSALG